MKLVLRLFAFIFITHTSAISIIGQEIPDSLKAAARLPNWIEVEHFNQKTERLKEELSDGEFISNIELQWHIPSDTRYYRTVVEIVSESGLKNNGEWSFTFDPIYETQHIHWARIIRDGKVVHNYDANSIRVYNTESDMASRMLNGSLTALLVLEDLRVGDILDVASSVTGTNPAFGDHTLLRRGASWSIPVGRQLTRILAPTDQVFQIKSYLTKQPEFSFNRELGLNEWRHESSKNKVVRTESSIPADVRVYAEVQVASFNNWGEVTQWALDLYKSTSPLPKEIEAEVERIKNSTLDPKKRITEALYFVQGNIRYLGLEMGHGAYQPRQPEVVWSRRFGDCKDKSLLLTRMLQSLGIDAHAALVNTGWLGGIADFLPSPLAFDHVIVSAIVDGERYWLDPTYNRQFGPLETIPVDDYGYALLIRDGENQLTQVSPHSGYENKIFVKTQLHVGQPGENSTMAVTTRYRGRQAHRTRDYFTNSSRPEIEKNYTEYWSRSYNHPELQSPLGYIEYPETGDVVVEERYKIDNAWFEGEGNEPHYFLFTPSTISDFQFFPERIERKLPYYLGEPVEISEEFEVHMFEPWDFDEVLKEIDTPALSYRNKTTWGSTIRSTYEFEIKKSRIEARDVGEFESNMRKIEDDLGWELTWDPSHGQKDVKYDNPIPYVLYAAGSAGCLMIGIPILTRKRIDPPKPIPSGCHDYEGLKGWLILPIIGLFLAPFSVVKTITSEDQSWIFDLNQWKEVSDAISPKFMWLVSMECLYYGVLLLAPILILIALFQKRWFLPYMMITLYLAQILYSILDRSAYEIFDLGDPTAAENTQVISNILVSSLWCTYFFVSKRVKATFRT